MSESETIKMSENINELAAALSKAQGEIGGAAKDAKNDFQGYEYTTLGSVIGAAKAPLAKNGLSYVQLNINDGDRVGVCTRLMHSSGQWIESTLALPIDTQKGRSPVQAAGSTLTYLRKYGLMGLLGIPSGDDPDGMSAENNGSTPATRTTERKKAARNDKATKRNNTPIANDATLDIIRAEVKDMIGEHHTGDAEAIDVTYTNISEHYGASFERLDYEQLQGVKAGIQRRMDKKMYSGDEKGAE